MKIIVVTIMKLIAASLFLLFFESCSTKPQANEELKTFNTLKQPVIYVSSVCTNGLDYSYTITVMDATGKSWLFSSEEIARAIVYTHNPGDTIGKPTKKKE